MNKIILFYKYIEIQYPKRIAKWQHKLCTELGLTGRIIIAHEGVNITLGGSQESLDRYKQLMTENPLFDNIDFKESPGGAECFPRLSIKIKREIVHLGIDPEKLTVKDGGIHLKPTQAHELMKTAPKDLIIFDTRNSYEWKIGTFLNAIKPNIQTFKELPEFIDSHEDLFKDKQVLMFCTGGVRCERATAYLKTKGIAKEVYQIEGGIQRYAEQFPDGFFRGKNYVFDGRVAVSINNDILAHCELCTEPCDIYHNCLHARCNKHFIGCSHCVSTFQQCCSKECFDAIKQGAPKRPEFKTFNYQPADAAKNSR